MSPECDLKINSPLIIYLEYISVSPAVCVGQLRLIAIHIECLLNIPI